jgi:uncharacterized protein YbjQ (UPF0145 family)
MMVVTSNEIPGWEIQRVCGEVFGLTVRSRNAFSQIGAGFKSMFGGELQGMTKNLTDSRNEVMGRMLEAARQKGGNAVVAMRFDTSEMADTWTELCAYGTAVVAVPVTDAAKETARAMGYGQPGGAPPTPEPVQAMAGGYPPQGYQQGPPPAYQQGPGGPGPGGPGPGGPGPGPGGPPPGYQQGPPPGYAQPGPPPGYRQQGPPPGYGPQGPPTGPQEPVSSQGPPTGPQEPVPPGGYPPQHAQ